MEIELERGKKSSGTIIKVIGVGGAGCNAINRMAKAAIPGCHLIAANTDMQSLANSKANDCLQIGTRTTRGLGAGADPTIGRKAAEEQRNLIEKALTGADMVFITAGMGGGTGTGAAPVVAEVAKKLGCLTVAVVTRPFHFEMTERMLVAQRGIEVLTKCVDTIIVIPNENLLNYSKVQLSVQQAFSQADDVLMQGVRGVSNLILQTGFINVDFADVCAVMKNRGNAMMSLAIIGADDDDQALLTKVLDNPLVEGNGIKGAHGLLINIEYGKDVLIKNVSHAIKLIANQANPKARCIQGLTPLPNSEKEMHITVIATGFQQNDTRPTKENHQKQYTPTENIPTFSNKTSALNKPKNKEIFKRIEENISTTNLNFSAEQESSTASLKELLNKPQQPNTPPVSAARSKLPFLNYNFLEKKEEAIFANNNPTDKDKEIFFAQHPENQPAENTTFNNDEVNDISFHNKEKAISQQEEKNIHTFATDPIKKRETPEIFQQSGFGLPLQEETSGNSKLGGYGKDKNKLNDLEKPAFLRAGKKIDFS